MVSEGVCSIRGMGLLIFKTPHPFGVCSRVPGPHQVALALCQNLRNLPSTESLVEKGSVYTGCLVDVTRIPTMDCDNPQDLGL